MLPINPILAAAAANMAIGMFWYSEYAFGPLWKKLKKEGSSEYKDLYQRLTIQAVASIMVASALYMAIMTFQKTQMTYAHEAFTQFYSLLVTDKENTTELIESIKTSCFIWLGFVFSGALSCFAWSNQMNLQILVIKTVGTLVQFLVTAAVLSALA